MIYIPAGGNSGECADFSMFINNETYNLIKSSKYISYHSPLYFEVDTFSDLKNTEDIIINQDISNQTIFMFDRDFSSPNNKEQLIKFLDKYE